MPTCTELDGKPTDTCPHGEVFNRLQECIKNATAPTPFKICFSKLAFYSVDEFLHMVGKRLNLKIDTGEIGV